MADENLPSGGPDEHALFSELITALETPREPQPEPKPQDPEPKPPEPKPGDKQPDADPHIPTDYGPASVRQGKSACKMALQQEFHLPPRMIIRYARRPPSTGDHIRRTFRAGASSHAARRHCAARK